MRPRTGARVAPLLTALASLALSLASLAQPLDLQLRSFKETKPGSDQWQVNEVLRRQGREQIGAISLKRPGQELHLRRVQPRAGSTVRMLGVEQQLKWRAGGTEGTVVSLPDSLQDPTQRRCREAYAFKLEP